jgi:hypothetical protein
MSIQGYNNRKLKKQKMIQKRKKACAYFEEQIRKTWSRNPGEGRLQAASLTSSCYCKKAGQLKMWSSFADFQASVKVLILSSNSVRHPSHLENLYKRLFCKIPNGSSL